MQDMDDLASKVSAAEPMSDERYAKLKALKEKLMAENQGEPVEVTLTTEEVYAYLNRKMFGMKKDSV